MSRNRPGPLGRQRAAVRPASEGHELLLALPGSVRELAAKAGVHPSSLSEWLRGVVTPRHEQTAKLEALGIPAEAWEHRPTGRTTGANLQAALRAVSDALCDLDDRVCALRSLIEPGWDE